VYILMRARHGAELNRHIVVYTLSQSVSQYTYRYEKAKKT